MLASVEIIKTPSVERLLEVWGQLYTPDFHTGSWAENSQFNDELLETASPMGRTKTVAKLDERLVELRCEVASIQTSSLYTYMQQVIDLREVKRLAEASFKVYKVLIELYQLDLLNSSTVVSQRQTARSSNSLVAAAGSTLKIEQLANAIEPVLLEFQDEHTRSNDWRALGFLTTQFNFCNQWMISNLTLSEQMLLNPYLKFVEEQVAHPWQRVCVAASRHAIESPVLTLVARMMPLSESIAQAAHQALIRSSRYHYSRRGKLTDPGVTHSCVRDFKMFQAYLWLCVLEESLTAVEQELLDLCVMVLPSVGVVWETIECWTPALSSTLLSHIDVSKHSLVLPYLTEMQEIFVNARSQFNTPLARTVSHKTRLGRK
jgi:hypothetical protein